MVIGACGYGATGSGALTDLLREFDETQVFDDFEFTYTYKVDGLQDLEYHLMKNHAKIISGDAAIYRFLKSSKYIYTPLINKPTSAKRFMEITNEYINSIVQTKYMGMETIDILSGNIIKNIFMLGMKKKLIPLFYENYKKKAYLRWPNRELYICIEPENFYDASKKYIKDILLEMGADFSKKIVLDQPFEGNAPENSFAFYDNPLAIVVDRDPRDLYLNQKYTCLTEGRFIPKDDVEKFVIYYRELHKNINYNNDRILRIKFEDMIYRYDETVEKIMKFLGLTKHKYPKRFFKPEHSAFNTQLIKKYPTDIDDIKYIEKNLSEFLYPFDLFPDVDTNGESFDGSEARIKKTKKFK